MSVRHRVLLEPHLLLLLISCFTGITIGAENKTSAAPVLLAQTLQVPTAFEKPQEPYKSITASAFNGSSICGPTSDAQLQEMWTGTGGTGAPPDDFAEAFNVSVAAAIWAYPLNCATSTYPSVFTDEPLSLPASAANSKTLGVKVNRFVDYPDLMNASFTGVVAPNTDTIYSSTFFDLTEGPLVFHIPASGGRFYNFEFLDAYTNVPLLIGPVTSPLGPNITREMNYVLVPPDYSGPAIPADKFDYVANFTTNVGWLVVRIFSSQSNKTDQAVAQAMQRSLKVSPLFPDQKTPTIGLELARAAAASALQPYSLTLVEGANISEFWTLAGKSIAINPPVSDAEAEFLDTLDIIGLSLEGFNASSLSKSVLTAMNLGLAAGLQCIDETAAATAKRETPTKWINIGKEVGDGFYGDPPDYMARSVFAKVVLAGNPPKQAVYFIAQSAFDPSLPLEGQPGIPLDGDKYNYTLTFPTYPNVTGFWSVTMYDAENRFLYGDQPHNAATKTFRYSINMGTAGTDFGDGKNYTIYMSKTQPPEGSLEYKNWLPIGSVPSSKFSVYLRLYGPDEATLNGTSYPPPVYIQKSAGATSA